MLVTALKLLALVAGGLQLASAISLNISDAASIRNATSTIAYDMLTYYTGNLTTPATGLLPYPPYYWWESGSMWAALLNYWHYTNDTTYNSLVSAALLANIGPADDFIVPAQQFDEGNDDQAFWIMSAMEAAELDFPATPDGYPSWFELAEAGWNTQVRRWNTSTCNGGLKWQIYPSNAGYDYKNSISNGAFFQMAARLLRYTGNSTYLTWASRSWDWSAQIGLIDAQTYAVYDGSSDLLNCTQLDHDLWTYNLGAYLLGAASMYNYTNGSTIWEQRTSGLVEAASAFFTPYPNASGIMYEVMCETDSTCDTDELSFKAYLSRTMWKTSQLAPFTADAISSVLSISAAAAASTCVGTVANTEIPGTVCGSRWYVDGFDNVYGVGQQMSALEVIQGLLITGTSAPIAGVKLNTTAPPIVESTTVVVSTSKTSETSAVVVKQTTTATATATATGMATKGFERVWGFSGEAGQWISGWCAFGLLVAGLAWNL